MDIVIEKIAYPGKSLARIDGKVVFTDHGLPGEKVKVSVIKEKKNYILARTIKNISFSPLRRETRCDHYRICSPYQYIDYDEQVKIKKQQILEAFGHDLKIDPVDIIFRNSPKIWGYRNKITLKVIHENGKQRLAYNQLQARDRFAPVENCFLSPNLTNSFLAAFSKVISAGFIQGISQLVVKENSDNKLLAAVYYNSSFHAEKACAFFEPLGKDFPHLNLICIDKDSSSRTVICGTDFLVETVSGMSFNIGAESFFQVNTPSLVNLSDDLKKNIPFNKNMVLADLYCGIGTFGILLSSKVKQVIGVESEDENFYFMKQNIAANNAANFTPYLSDCKKYINSLSLKKVDVAIIDPPRKGLDPDVCNALKRSGLPVIVYISCDLATLIRDLKILLPSYKIKNIFGYDFYPHTPHIETMVILALEDLS
ncbi:MAG: 23S rRNA (uracil(1939)-C(5))-methyltransferase RlmD [Candidatus Aadella gelida]|nr:23S rRNA (uracil(1939)-C(5))-methyltransferase RlmD [Candidatus Aadella gelida]